MSGRKTSQLVATLTGAALDKDADLFKIEDVSEALDVDKDKKITASALMFGAFMGAKVRKSADQTTANYSGAGAIIAFNAEDYDIGGWHDNVTNNTRFTVPAGVTKVGITVAIYATLVSASTSTSFYVRKNGVVTPNNAIALNGGDNGANTVIYASGYHEDKCVAGDYYEVHAIISDNSVTIETETYFAIRAIG